MRKQDLDFKTEYTEKTDENNHVLFQKNFCVLYVQILAESFIFLAQKKKNENERRVFTYNCKNR